MESRILGALSQFDGFLLNPLIQGHSPNAPKTSRNTLGTNQGTNEDDSQNDSQPEASVFQSQTKVNSSPDDGYDKLSTLLFEKLGPLGTIKLFVHEKCVFLCCNALTDGVRPQTCSETSSTAEKRKPRSLIEPCLSLGQKFVFIFVGFSMERCCRAELTFNCIAYVIFSSERRTTIIEMFRCMVTLKGRKEMSKCLV